MPFKPLDRRTFLRAAGVCIGLPLLDAMLPVGLGAEQQGRGGAPRRMVLIGRPLGLHAPFLLPGEGRQGLRADALPEARCRRIASDFTVFSGMSHRGYAGGHRTEVALLTGVRPKGIRLSDIRNTISLDQEVAARIGGETRFASLVLGGGDLLLEPQRRARPVAAPGHAGLRAAVHRRHAGGGGPRDAPHPRRPEHPRRRPRPGADAGNDSSAPPTASGSTCS